MSDDKPLKRGLRRGGGPPPGYCVDVWLLESAYKEALSAVEEAGVAHLAAQVKEIAKFEHPMASSRVVDVRLLSGYDGLYELRDRGNVFGGANVRLFFGFDDETKELTVLTFAKKQNNGQTPKGVLVRARNRYRKFKEGFFSSGEGSLDAS